MPEAAVVAERLAPGGPGWVVVRSAVLGEPVLWVRDAATPFPRAVAGIVRYTRAELDALDAAGHIEPADLQALHRLKRTLGGTIERRDLLPATGAGAGADGGSLELFARLPAVHVRPGRSAPAPVTAPSPAPGFGPEEW